MLPRKKMNVFNILKNIQTVMPIKEQIQELEGLRLSGKTEEFKSKLFGLQLRTELLIRSGKASNWQQQK